MILCGAEGTVSNLVGNSMILTTLCGAVRQQTISVMPEVYVSRLCERLCGVRRRTAAPETQLWRIWGAGVVLGSRRLIHILALLVWPAQFGVAKSPNHPAEIDEKRAHDQNHERVGLHHGFVDWRCHRLWWMVIGSELPKCAQEQRLSEPVASSTWVGPGEAETTRHLISLLIWQSPLKPTLNLVFDGCEKKLKVS